VRCERARPAKGIWHRYAGRSGTVVVPRNYSEVGVRLDGCNNYVWFSPDELVLI
jgi:hypothetical protein